MNTDQDQFKSKNDDRERPLEMTSNGLSAESGDSNEEVIELTDVIKKGKGFENSDADFKFEQGPAQANSGSDMILGPDDDNLEKIIAGLESELELGDTEAIQVEEGPVSPTPQDEPITSDAKSAAEEDKPSLESQDEAPEIPEKEEEEAAASSDSTEEAEAPFIEAEEESSTTPPVFDEATVLSEEDLGAMEEEKPSFEGFDDTPEISVKGINEEASSSEISDEAPMDSEEDKAETDISLEEASDVVLSISDDQIERILRPMVRDVIERTVRETVADVAERVIKEAIDSLKASIEPPRE